jgi:hypothetical protein
MNGANGETRITELWLLERPHSKLRLAITMVGHGI